MWQKAKNVYHLLQALAAASYFGFPSKKLTVIGVTGTDGKTTTVSMIHHALESMGKKSAMVSSVGASVNGNRIDTGFHVTTPNPWKIQRLLKQAVQYGAQFMVLEATSHGLDQNRLAFIRFKVAVLTNITHEHLDYHGSIKNYMATKAKLFKKAQTSILNLDDASFPVLNKLVKGNIKTYSLQSKKADYSAHGIDFNIKVPGLYNRQNALAAYAASRELGLPEKGIIRALNSFSGVRGRFEKIDVGQDFAAVVDFAHTPNSVKNVLIALRDEVKSKNSKLIAVFGAAGQRDKSKRPLMGEIAEKFANMTIITSEDPRSEDPEKIAQEIVSGMKNKKEGSGYRIVTDRREAIKFAVSIAKTGDAIGFFGKGHEKTMCIGKKELPWDEVKEVEVAIRRRSKH